MGTVNVVLGEDTRLNLILGQQLENAVTEVVFDFSAWKTTYGTGTLALSVQRPGDDQPYAVTLSTSGTDATWSVTNLDTAYKGVGHIQLTYTVGSAIKKSVVYKFTVYESLGANGEYPSPGQTWQEGIEDDIEGLRTDVDADHDELIDIREGADGVTYPSAGDAVRGQITGLKQDFTDLEDRVEVLEQGGTGGGLTADLKAALDQLAQKVAYIDEDGQDYYDALHNALYPPADLVSISAVYTQSGTVYDTDTLDSLKADLVVTAHMSDSTTQTVTTYTLSGTLTEGTSTITVSYGGKTTTFDVTVTEKVITTITASSDGVDFGSMDNTRPTNNPPYVTNSNKSRIHYLGTNNLGVAINPNKTYKISITTNLTTCQVGVLSFNNTAKTNIANLQAASNTNKADTGWQSVTQASPYVYTPPASINGEEPVMAWLNFRKSTNDSNWSDINDSIFPVTVEEL